MRKGCFWGVCSTFLLTTALASLCSPIALGGSEREADVTIERIEREGLPDAHYVTGSDPELSAARDQAEATVDQFIAALKNPTPSQSSFSIKLVVQDQDNIEHLWLNPVRYQDGSFYGTVNNAPITITTIRLGDEVGVVADQISDWMFVDNGKLVGGYTIRAMREKMSDDEREALDRQLEFTIE